MYRLRIVVLTLTALAAIAWCRPASASTSLGLGGDYLFDPHAGELQLTLAADTPLARHVAIGARFGVMFLTDPGRVGVPLDLRLRVRAARVYVDGLVGPYFVFNESDWARFHAGFGFGVLMRSFSLGLEVGYLNPTAMLGVRLAFPL